MAALARAGLLAGTAEAAPSRKRRDEHLYYAMDRLARHMATLQKYPPTQKGTSLSLAD